MEIYRSKVCSCGEDMDAALTAALEARAELDTIDERIARAVADYLAKNPPSGGSALRVGEVTLLAANWVGNASPYAQVVALDGITNFSQVDLTPSVEQLAVFYNKDLAFVTENVDGVVTVYAIGQKPTNDYTIQVTILEVAV